MSLTPSRRRVLQTALLAPVASACTTTRRSRPEPVDPDVALRAAAVTREQALLDLYTAAESSAPALAARLGLVRAEHEQHLTALGAPSPAPSGSATPAATRPVAAPSPATLAAAERSAAQAHAAAALVASRPLAAVLASLAACEASHQVVLT